MSFSGSPHREKRNRARVARIPTEATTDTTPQRRTTMPDMVPKGAPAPIETGCGPHSICAACSNRMANPRVPTATENGWNRTGLMKLFPRKTPKAKAMMQANTTAAAGWDTPFADRMYVT